MSEVPGLEMNCVGCPCINNVVVGNSGVAGVRSLLMGLLVNGSRSYNLNNKILLIYDIIV